MKILLWPLACLLPAVVSAWKPRYLARQVQSLSSSAANTCPVQYNVVSTLAPTVQGQPLAVQSNILSNTTFVASPYNATITVNNAPTLLDTTITAYSTITQTVVRTYVTVSSDYTGSTTYTSTISDSAASSGAPQTVVVFYPRRFAVVTSFGTGSTAYTSTISPTAAGQSGTIVVYQPPQYATSTTVYAGTVASTSTVSSPGSPDQTGQLVVYQPGNYATTTVLYDGSTTSTSTQTPASSGGQTTLVVNVPRTYVTLTSTYQGSATSLSTQFTPTQTGQTGTQVLLVPGNYVTSTTVYDGASTVTSTQIPASSGGPTIILVQIPRAYVTITSTYQGSATSLSTQFTPTQTGQTGTQVLLVPGNYVTSTVLYDGASTATSTQTPATSGGATTILVQIPRTYVTLTSTYQGSATSLSTQFTPTQTGQTGTQVLLVPGNYVTTTVLYDGASTVTSTQTPATSGGATTILVQIPRTYVTLTSIYQGSATSLSTQFTPSQTGQTGTQVLLVPGNYVTTTVLYDGASTVTSTQTPATSGGATTLVVNVPRTYVTSTTYYVGSATSLSTAFTPTQTGQTGSQVLYVPAAAVTSSQLYDGATTNIYTTNVVTAPSQTYSVIAQIPRQYTTVTTTYNGASTAYSTQTQTVITQPGTVYVQVPRQYTTINTLYDGSSVQTSTQSYSGSASVGTVYINYPRPYTTISTTYGGASTQTTTSFTPTSYGQTGTVYVQVPQSLSTITTTIGATVGYTSTSTVTVSGTPSPVAVVAVPVRPFHILITDYSTGVLPNYIGYLDVSSAPTSGTSYSATIVPYVSSGTFYIDQATSQMIATPQTGANSVPLYSVQSTSIGAGNGVFLFDPSSKLATTNPVTVTYWPDQTLHLVNTGNNNYLAYACNGTGGYTLWMGPAAPPAGCVQAVLSPIYDQQNYTSTTITSGSTTTTLTKAPTGSTVSSTGTVSIITPTASVVVCSGVYGYNNTGYSSNTNAGLLYAIWDQPWTNQASLVNSTYMGVYADPYAWGQTTRIGAVLPFTLTSYRFYDDSPVLDPRTVNIMHTAYLFARTAGTYTFTVTNPDDVIYLWIGPYALSGWTNNNANYTGFYPQGGGTVPVTLQANTYTPFRLLWGNTGGGAGLTLTVTDPNNAQLLNSTGSTDIVVQPCPGSGSSATAAVVAPTCSGGLEWAQYPNPIPCPNNCAVDTTGYSPFVSNYFNQNSSLLPVRRGLTGTYEPSFQTDGSGNMALYGTANSNYATAALVYRAYFVPPVSGVYRFSYGYYSSQADDITYIWTNQNSVTAWTGWSDANENIRATYFPPTSANAATNTLSYQFPATVGQYVPFTLLWANAAQGGGMGLTTTFPNGTSTTAMAGLFLSPGCNTPTTTVPTCTASGLAYAAYNHGFGTGSVVTDAYWLGFNASYFNPAPSATPLFSGVATNINLNYPSGAGTIYGQPASRNLIRVGITYQGYFTVPLTGTYIIALASTDDVAYIWMGATVQAGNWNETNWNIRGTYNIQNRRPISQTFLANQLYPIAVLWANGDGGAQMQITITAPSGQVYTDTSGFFVQPSCATSLPVAVAQPPIPARCSDAGIEWFQRPWPAGTTYLPDNYSPPTATPYTTLKLSGVANDMTFYASAAQSTNTLVYGQGPIDTTQSTTILRGYIIPNVTGVHTVSLGSPDDVGYLWIGNTAVSGWKSTNALIAGAQYQNLVPITATYNFASLAPVPIRFAFGQAGGVFSYTFSLTPPGALQAQTNTTGFFQAPECGPIPYSQWT